MTASLVHSSEPTAVQDVAHQCDRHAAGPSMPTAAAVAGVGLLVMAALALMASARLDSLVVDGDASATARHLATHELAFRFAVCGFAVVAVLDVVVAWALYWFFRSTDSGGSMLAAVLRVVYAAVFLASLSHLLAAARAAGTAAPVSVMAAVDAFKDLWAVALVLFGVHLVAVGYLSLRSRMVPKIVGVLVVLSGAGYLVDSFGKMLSNGYGVDVARLTFVGELALMVWLLWSGRRVSASIGL